MQALEKVLRTKPNTLVVEAYFDNAPEPIKKFTNDLREILIEKKIPEIDNINEIQKEILIQKYKDFPMIKIFELFRSLDNLENPHFVHIDNIDENSGIDLTITDDGLSPLIPNGSKVHVVNCNSYNNGDLVAARIEQGTEI